MEENEPNPPTSPVSPVPDPPTPTSVPATADPVARFRGLGTNFRAKLIGIDDVPDSRGDQMCQESIIKLKAAVMAAGRHKQKIIINVSLEGIKIVDVMTGEVQHVHPVHRISFIARDTTDRRAFGYVYGAGEGRHQFYGIKTAKAAENLVLALRDLFQVVFDMKKKEMDEAKASQGSDGQEEAAAPTSQDPATQQPQQPPPQSGDNILDLKQQLNHIQEGINTMDAIGPWSSGGGALPEAGSEQNGDLFGLNLSDISSLSSDMSCSSNFLIDYGSAGALKTRFDRSSSKSSKNSGSCRPANSSRTADGKTDSQTSLDSGGFIASFESDDTARAARDASDDLGVAHEQSLEYFRADFMEKSEPISESEASCHDDVRTLTGSVSALSDDTRSGTPANRDLSSADPFSALDFPKGPVSRGFDGDPFLPKRTSGVTDAGPVVEGFDSDFACFDQKFEEKTESQAFEVDPFDTGQHGDFDADPFAVPFGDKDADPFADNNDDDPFSNVDDIFGATASDNVGVTTSDSDKKEDDLDNEDIFASAPMSIPAPVNDSCDISDGNSPDNTPDQSDNGELQSRLDDISEHNPDTVFEGAPSVPPVIPIRNSLDVNDDGHESDDKNDDEISELFRKGDAPSPPTMPTRNTGGNNEDSTIDNVIDTCVQMVPPAIPPRRDVRITELERESDDDDPPMPRDSPPMPSGPPPVPERPSLKASPPPPKQNSSYSEDLFNLGAPAAQPAPQPGAKLTTDQILSGFGGAPQQQQQMYGMPQQAMPQHVMPQQSMPYGGFPAQSYPQAGMAQVPAMGVPQMAAFPSGPSPAIPPRPGAMRPPVPQTLPQGSNQNPFGDAFAGQPPMLAPAVSASAVAPAGADQKPASSDPFAGLMSGMGVTNTAAANKKDMFKNYQMSKPPQPPPRTNVPAAAEPNNNEQKSPFDSYLMQSVGGLPVANEATAPVDPFAFATPSTNAGQTLDFTQNGINGTSLFG